MKFNELKIKKIILDGIQKANYQEMTDIQTQIIPVALSNHDVIGQAPTGTGKTCAFVVPTLERFNLDDRFIQTLVLCPTRELALQITNEYKKIGEFINGLKILAIYGGQKINQQLRLLRDQPQIIIGTPGRLLDHLERKTINLTRIRTVVLDEADEMLDMGFIRDIDKILHKVSGHHQTILLSATMDKNIMEISKKYQKDPKFFKATIEKKDIPSISQHYIKTPEFKKIEVITKLIKDKQFYLVLIFTNTRRKAKELVRRLRDQSFKVDALHSDLKQSARERVMRAFREGQLQILVATDIAARGIDVKGVDAVINYDVPKDMKYYIHRIGRTARAKMVGSAYTLIAHDVHHHLHTIEKEIKEHLNEHKMEGIDFSAPLIDKSSFRREHNNFQRNHRDGHAQHETFSRQTKSFGTTTRFFITIGTKDNIDNKNLAHILSKDMNIPLTDITDV
jgi:ATP-dependent RNA helicase DeaD